MHVYIDDSGDGGFKFGQGSTSHLVMAACVFRDPDHITDVVARIDACASRNRVAPEFHYSETKRRIADCFFECIGPAKFHVRAIVIDKKLVYSEHLRSSPSALKSFAIRMLLTKNWGEIKGAKIFIDGEDTKAFGVKDGEYLKRMVNRESPGTIADVRFVASETSRPIQLADMIAGAINRANRTHRPADPRHYQTFASRAWQPRGQLWFWK